MSLKTLFKKWLWVERDFVIETLRKIIFVSDGSKDKGFFCVKFSDNLCLFKTNTIFHAKCELLYDNF